MRLTVLAAGVLVSAAEIEAQTTTIDKSADWGTVARGTTADLVVLARNPLADIANVLVVYR